MSWLNPKEVIAENYRLCEIEFQDGRKVNGYLSSARGWFSEHGANLKCKPAIKRYRYIEDRPIMPWVRHADKRQGGAE